MKSKLIKIIKFTGFLTIGVLLLFFAFRGIDLDSLINDLLNAKYRWVLLSLLFAIISHISRALRWNLLIEPLGFKPKLSNTFYSLMLGYLANFAFPRLGEVTRCASLSKKEKIPVDRLFGTVILERAIDLLSLLILLTILIIFRFETFGGFFNDNIFIPLGEKINNTFSFSKVIWVGTGIILISLFAAYLKFREELSKIGVVIKIKEIVKGVLEGLKTVYKMKKFGSFIFHTVFIWLNYLLMTWVVVFSLSSTSELGIIDGLFLLVIGGLGMSVPVQGGIGAYHWIVSRGLFAVYENITIEEGLVFATLSHESQSLMILIVGIISFILLLRKNKSVNSTD